ncbi:MAG TPA: ABC transporter permease [Longimicrobiales bacterium]|nr:ABC transporter permease [Longimicrobiales bacterium]
MSVQRRSRMVRLAVAIYSRASALLPRSFRRGFREELVACFARIAGEARGRGRVAVVGVTARAIVDLVGRAPREHLAAARAGALGASTGWAGTLQDVRQAGRRLSRRPSFAGATVLTLGLGIAAATSVFSLVHGVVLSPLDYPGSDRIVLVDHGGAGLGIDRGLGVTYGFYRFYAERARTAESMAMYSWLGLTLTGRGEPVRLEGVRATPSLDEVLGVRPLLGRWFTAAEGAAGAAPTVVLSHGLWRERFGGDRSVVGRTAELAGQAFEVVGVMPASFAFPSADARLWIARAVPATGIGGWNEQAVARLAAGATPQVLEAELASLLPVLRRGEDDPARVAMYLDEARVTPRVVTLKESIVGDIRPMLWVLLGTVAFVLLIAVANVANLFLVRAEEGQRESAVRTALGADGARLVRGAMAETLLIAGAAAAVAVPAAAACTRLLRLRAPVNVPRLEEVGLDPVVLGAALATSLAAAVVLGLIPALRRRGDLGAELKESAGRTTVGRRRIRGRNILVAAQVALALVLLIGSGLLFRTFQQLRAVDLGFTERRALTFEIGLPESRYETPAQRVAFHRGLLPRLEAIPGVETAAAVGRCLPLVPSMCWGETLQAEGAPTPEGQVPPVTGVRIATTDYFRAMGIPVRGRTFESADEGVGQAVAILSEAAAAAYFPGENALGGRVRFEGDSPWLTVVGVAANVRGRVATDDFTRLIYLPLPSEAGAGPPPSFLSYVVTTTVPAASIASAVRQAVADADPAIPVASVRTLDDLIAAATAPAAFALTLIGVAAAIALLLGAIGVYAVVAYAVSCRTTEIGVRMALGAGAREVRAMVVRQGFAVVLAGIVAGLAAAFGLTRLMEGMLFGVSPTDPLSYVILTALMMGIAAVALYVPAWRASRVRPLEALRSR